MKPNKSFHILSLVLAIAVAFAALVPSKALAASKDEPAEPSIVEIAISVNEQSGEFSTLIAALKATNLVKKLDGKRNFTVFAPTDAAFAQLGLNAGNVGSLPKAKLTDILLYHVARGERFSQSVVEAKRIRMANGDFAPVKVTSEGAFIDRAKIVTTDINASNGVIHIIDQVMLPPAN